MSVEAITWALKQQVGQSSAKFVLVVMANCADAEGFCWPSNAYLCESTGQDRKTVIANTRRLCVSGWIRDTGHRKGKTGQVIVYRLNVENSADFGAVKESQNRNGTENGTVPNFPPKSPVFPVEESRFSRPTVPKTGHGTVMDTKEEPLGKPKARKRAADFTYTLPDWIPQDVWDAYLRVRTAKRSPMTEDAFKGCMRRLETFRKQGDDPIAVLQQSIDFTYTGLFPIKNQQRPQQRSSSNDRQQRRANTIANLTGSDHDAIEGYAVAVD